MGRKILVVLIVFLIILSGCGEPTEPEVEGAITFDLGDESYDLSQGSNAVYNANLNLTIVCGYGEARELIEIHFPGASTGTFEGPTGGGRIKYLNPNAMSHFTDDRAHGYKGQFYKINVTSYGTVGELVEGTFSAYMSGAQERVLGGGRQELIYNTIEGSFSVIRMPEK